MSEYYYITCPSCGHRKKRKKPSGKPRGFAALSPERRKEIARSGGLAGKPENRVFSYNLKLAQRAGRKGGNVLAAKRRREKESK